MKYLSLLIITLLFMHNSNAQIYELGIFAGGSNFIGDVGSTKYISPNSPAYGGVFKWNRSPRHAFRASIIATDLEGIDANSDDPRRRQRDYSFKNEVLEVSAGLEFTFLDFDLHQIGVKGTPYLYTGIIATTYNNYYFNNAGVQTSEETSSWALGIPMTLGFKTNLFSPFILAAEVGARYTFTDELDGSVSENKNRQDFSIGNTNSNDWYLFSGITLTYSFGKKPCYCNY